MSCVRFKFKSALEYDKVTFDGLQISVADLREKIMTLKKMNSTDNYTLNIMDAQTRKVYEDDKTMISRNSTVIVMRVPKLPQNKFSKTNYRMQETNFLQDDNDSSSSSVTTQQLRKTADLAAANASEEEKVRAMISQAGEDFNPNSYAKFKVKGVAFNTMTGVMKAPPPNYICHRCGQKGHWIKFCPTNGDPSYDNMRLKRSSGIPNSNVVAATSNVPGAMIDRFGNVVVRTVDLAAADKKTTINTSIELPGAEKIPSELTCNICKELVRDAVIIPCCGECFCDECIRGYLIDNDFSCYSCKQVSSPESLVANKPLRTAAKNFLIRQKEKKSIAIARGLPSVVISNDTVQPSAPSLSQSSSSSSTNNNDTLPANGSPQSPTTTDALPQSSPEVTSITTICSDTINSTVSTASSAIPTTTTSDDDSTRITAPIMMSPLVTNPRPVIAPPIFPQPSLLLPSYQLAPPPSILSNPFLPQPKPSVPPVSSMARMTELLAAADKKDSAPPLSAEEFYMQQELLRNLKRSRSRSSRSFSSVGSSLDSRSPSPYKRRRKNPSSYSPESSDKHKDKAKKKKKQSEEEKHKLKHKKKRKRARPVEEPPLNDKDEAGVNGIVVLSHDDGVMENCKEYGGEDIDNGKSETPMEEDVPPVEPVSQEELQVDIVKMKKKKKHKKSEDGSLVKLKHKRHHHRHHHHHQDDKKIKKHSNNH